MALFDQRDSEKEVDLFPQEILDLILSLESNDRKKRESAILHLKSMRKSAVVPLLKSLDSDSSLIQSGAAEILGTYGDAALPTLLRLVTTGKERVRRGAAIAIAHNGKKAKRYLKDLLSDDDYRARRGAVLTLGYLEHSDSETEVMLLNALEDENREVRLQAALSLENLNWKPKRQIHQALFFRAKGDLNSLISLGTTALPVLEKELLNADSEKKGEIADILSGIDDDKAKILLVGMLGDKDKRVRKKAAEAVGNSCDKRLWPYLVKSLDDPDADVRAEVAWALDKSNWKPSNNNEKAKYLILKERWIDLLEMKEAAIPALINSLKDKDPDVRLKSTEILREMGNPGYSAINTALKSEDPELKRAAAEAAAFIKRKKEESGQKRISGAQKTADEEIERQIRVQKTHFGPKNTQSEGYWAELMRKNGMDEKRVVRFSKTLSDDNEILRTAAVESLKSAGDAGIQCLIALLSDSKQSVRIAAIEALGDIEAKTAASEIAGFTADKNESVRMACAHSLGQIKDPKTLPALIRMFSDKNPAIREEASDSVAKFGRLALPILNRNYLDPAIIVRVLTLRSAGRICDTGSISLCVRMFNDAESEVRSSAITAIRILSKPFFNPVIDESQRILIQGTLMEKLGIITALAGINELRAKKVIAVFESDKDETVREHAHLALTGNIPEINNVPVKTLKQKKPKGDSVKKTSEEKLQIIADLKSDNKSVRMKAAEKIFLTGDEMIDPLLDAFYESNPKTRNLIGEILSGLGDRAEKGLIKALNTGSPGVKMTAAQNLGKILDKNSVNALCEVLLHESDPVIRTVAAESLGFMQDFGSVDALIHAANDENRTVRRAAISSLGYIGDKKAIETLITAFKDNDPYIHGMATEALRKSGPKAKDILISALRTEKKDSRERIAKVLDELGYRPETEEDTIYYLIAKKDWEKLEKVGKPVIGPLSVAITDDDIDTRIGAINVIAKTGEKDAVLPLAKALCDRTLVVRKRAESAIITIGRPALPALEKIVSETTDPNERTSAMNLIRKISE
ncbi:MAG: HEAT repeat domain-containing protein [Methanomicrobiaceae archaeon]|nr:HEAT repeat domain-containing protein [Methanomicrobiaceae archaeon]